MSAVADTPDQSEITSKPPTLYQVDRINVPADLPEVARLMYRELNKIAESQSMILTLWKKAQDNQSALEAMRLQIKSEIYAELAAAGIELPDARQ
ncbi:hypothetical protein GZZ44_10530 [Klebsiella aerogenes]|uniref:hypothetical protein n=1 Tax=Klebsiella aerogenes TaxID=548 RepID=UPI00190E612D|nr:hypothetical protein [Klebsiella aerogenes]MBK0633383.1 hypothetical protein [Klebsiella aerogenes]